MKTVRVNKKELLEILCENRKKHKEQYKESIKAFRVKAADLLNKELQKIIAGKKFETYFDLQKPISHEKDYDLVIKMVEMSVDDILELEQSEFNQLVNDEWTWKSSFRLSVYSNYSYSGSSGISGTSGTGSSGSDGDYFIPITFPDVDMKILKMMVNNKKKPQIMGFFLFIIFSVRTNHTP